MADNTQLNPSAGGDVVTYVLTAEDGAYGITGFDATIYPRQWDTINDKQDANWQNIDVF